MHSVRSATHRQCTESKARTNCMNDRNRAEQNRCERLDVTHREFVLSVARTVCDENGGNGEGDRKRSKREARRF